jgi:predicted RNase H-like HicB family nuclease
MNFVAAIEPGDETHAFGVVVPDLPGCFSAGDTLDEAMANAREAIEAWCESVIDAGEDIPAPGDLAEHRANPDYAGWIWAVVSAPVERYLGPAQKLNITLPKRLLARVDDYTAAHGESRSGFLARAALTALQEDSGSRPDRS